MTDSPERPLWAPTEELLASRRLTRYADWLEKRGGRDFREDYTALHRWSVEEAPEFWRSLIEYFDLPRRGFMQPAVVGLDKLPGARWFPELQLNYAECLLQAPDDALALMAVNEAGEERRLTYADLRHEAARVQAFIDALGMEPGERAAAVLPNVPEAVSAMLGAAASGVTFSSVSPDFGVSGMLDRLGQVAPRILVVCELYRFGGKSFDVGQKMAEVVRGLPSVERVIVVGARSEDAPDYGDATLTTWRDLLDTPAARKPDYRPLPFAHPLYVVFTSGTTGKPKCIVHSAGGTLIQLLKEHSLHCDLGPGDVAFFPTTLGWMMWNWLVNGLATGACLVLYDGSPTYPRTEVLADLAVRYDVTLLGLASALIETYRKAGLDLTGSHDFSKVRLIFAGGSILSREAFVYAEERLAPGTWLASCTGGTDILSCFICTNPWGPVYAGELQVAALGMDVQVFDDDGNRVVDEKGELVCCRPAPSMPLGFLDDPDGKRFHSAYFDRFDGVWAHGDFVRETPRGGFVVYGRSDSVLNPGGVRIGTAEIYRQVAKLPEIDDAVVVGVEGDDDIVIALYVVLRGDGTLDDALAERIRKTIRSGASPRHVPGILKAVADIPRTRNGKIAESAVREAVNGRHVRQLETLANPESLDGFKAADAS